MKYKCLTTNNKTMQRLFLKLPNYLYERDKNPQNKTVEKQILEGTHVLSKDFVIFPFVMVDENRKPVCRCILTCYENDPIGYVGFFESYDCQTAVDEMMCYVARKAMDEGKSKLMGPINSSIYIGYRFKMDRFDSTYTGEPYNKETYYSLWKKNGFEVSDRYLSNHLIRVPKNYVDEKMQRICDRYNEREYEIFSPTKEMLYDCLVDVYGLLMKSFSNFVGYKHITEEQFMDMFIGLGDIADLDMIKLAYNSDCELKAFSIALPNYGDLLLGKLTLAKKLKIAKIKKNPSEYVILYAGADKATAGLGCAVSYDTMKTMRKKQCSSIGALIHEGNMTSNLYSDLHDGQYHYTLLTKQLIARGDDN